MSLIAGGMLFLYFKRQSELNASTALQDNIGYSKDTAIKTGMANPDTQGPVAPQGTSALPGTSGSAADPQPTATAGTTNAQEQYPGAPYIGISCWTDPKTKPYWAEYGVNPDDAGTGCLKTCPGVDWDEMESYYKSIGLGGQAALNRNLQTYRGGCKSTLSPLPSSVSGDLLKQFKFLLFGAQGTGCDSQTRSYTMTCVNSKGESKHSQSISVEGSSGSCLPVLNVPSCPLVTEDKQPTEIVERRIYDSITNADRRMIAVVPGNDVTSVPDLSNSTAADSWINSSGLRTAPYRAFTASLYQFAGIADDLSKLFGYYDPAIQELVTHKDDTVAGRWRSRDGNWAGQWPPVRMGQYTLIIGISGRRWKLRATQTKVSAVVSTSTPPAFTITDDLEFAADHHLMVYTFDFDVSVIDLTDGRNLSQREISDLKDKFYKRFRIIKLSTRASPGSWTRRAVFDTNDLAFLVAEGGNDPKKYASVKGSSDLVITSADPGNPTITVTATPKKFQYSQSTPSTKDYYFAYLDNENLRQLFAPFQGGWANAAAPPLYSSCEELVVNTVNYRTAAKGCVNGYLLPTGNGTETIDATAAPTLDVESYPRLQQAFAAGDFLDCRTWCIVDRSRPGWGWQWLPGINAWQYSNQGVSGCPSAWTGSFPGASLTQEFANEVQNKPPFCKTNDRVVAMFFSKPWYQFAPRVLEVGDYGNLSWIKDWFGSENWDDRIQSLKVPPGYQVTLFTDPNFTGTPTYFTSDTPVVTASASSLTFRKL